MIQVGDEVFETVTDGNGRFYLSQIPEGEHEVVVGEGETTRLYMAVVEAGIRAELPYDENCTSPEIEYGEITGVVCDPESHSPIVGGEVSVDAPGNAGLQRFEASTDSDGRFTISVPVGVHEVEVRFDGRIRTFESIAVNSGQTTTLGYDEACTVVAPVVGTIEGVLCDPESHELLSGASIRIDVREDGSLNRFETTTNATGAFSIVVPVGTHRLEVRFGDRVRVLENIAVLDGQVTTLAFDEACVVPPEPKGTVVGRFCSPGQDIGIGDAEVYVDVVLDGVLTRIETRTDSNGDFRLEDVPAGVHEVTLRRNSFVRVVDGVVVVDSEVVSLDEAGLCTAPVPPRIRVYQGEFDKVDLLLAEMGFSDIDVRDEPQAPSLPFFQVDFLIDEFSDPANLNDVDIVFISCHGVLLAGSGYGVNTATLFNQMGNISTTLRNFVLNGGSIYFSDWGYSVFEAAFPDAADWYGDDDEKDAAHVGAAQNFSASVVNSSMESFLGRSSLALDFDLSGVALPESLGAGSSSLVEANLSLTLDGNATSASNVPVVFEHVIPMSGENAGRIIFTAPHAHGGGEDGDMADVLSAIIYSL